MDRPILRPRHRPTPPLARHPRLHRQGRRYPLPRRDRSPRPGPRGRPVTNRRWLAIDADIMGKPFTLDLYHQFGWTGVGTWVAFLCACKRSRTPGTIRFLNQADALAQLGLLGLDLIDNDGKEWSLDDFWTFTGRKKQTRRT